MSNRLPSTRTTQALSPAEVSRAEARIEVFHGRLAAHPAHPTRYCVPREKAVTTAERQALSAVGERLVAELQPWSNRGHVDAIVTRLLIGFEQGRARGEDEDEVLVGEYIAALKGLPLAAIVAAAERVRSGETLIRRNSRFRPQPPEFADEVREGLVEVRTKLVHIRRILDAEVYDPPTAEQRKAVKAAAAAYLEGRGFPDEERRPIPMPGEIAAARDASLREQGAAMVRACDSEAMARLNARLTARGVPENLRVP